jgi:hypothetical protein
MARGSLSVSGKRNVGRVWAPALHGYSGGGRPIAAPSKRRYSRGSGRPEIDNDACGDIAVLQPGPALGEGMSHS